MNPNRFRAADRACLEHGPGLWRTGSTVRVEFDGRVSINATVDGAVNLSAAFHSGVRMYRRGFYYHRSLRARPRLRGNAGTADGQALTIDTDVPTSPIVSSYTRDGLGVFPQHLDRDGSSDQVTLTEVASDGNYGSARNNSFHIGGERSSDLAKSCRTARIL